MKLFPLVVALLLSSAARADVMYQWEPLDGATPHGVMIEFTFTDAVVASGGYAFHAQNGRQAPTAGLVSFQYSYPDSPRPIWITDHSNMVDELLYLDANLAFNPDGTMMGSFTAMNFESAITVTDSQITWASSDAGMWASGCPTMGNCAGARGVFQRIDPVTPQSAQGSDVPEPASLALVSFGLLGALRKRRS